MTNKFGTVALLVCTVAVALVAGLGLTGCQGSSTTADGLKTSTQYDSLESYDFEHKRIGCITGTLFGQVFAEKYPSAVVSYYTNRADMVAALESGKIDIIGEDKPLIGYIATEVPYMFCIDEPLFTTDIGFAFSKNERGTALSKQFNDFLARIRESGELEVLKTKWISGVILDSSVEDYENLPADNGTLTFATELSNAPMSYVSNGHPAGFEIELAIMFCKEYGYGMEIMDTTFNGVLDALASGKCDFGGDCISITAERAESMVFSNPIIGCDGVMVYISQEEAEATKGAVTSVDELTGKRIGVLVGSSISIKAEEIAGPSGKVLYFGNISDLPAALDSGKIDAYVNDKSLTLPLLSQYTNQVMLRETLDEFEDVFILNKDDPESSGLVMQLNEYLAKCKSDGTLSSLESKWMVSTAEDQKVVDYPTTGTVRTLKVAVSTSVGAPHVYYKDNKLVGFDVEILAGFAEEYGYGLELSDMDFSGIISSVTAGKSDIGASGVIKTAERAESMLLSDGYYNNSAVCVVGGEATSEGFFESLVTSFEKTFLRESRWEMFVAGIFNTLLITFCSLLLGTLLGFAVFVACRNGGRVVNAITRFCVWLVNGMPTVVLLMVLFYVVFGATNLGGVIVSIIAFTLIFASSVIGMLKTGVSAVDSGQEEAARAMGFSRNQAFYQIVLPQAIRHVVNIYESEMVTLLKGTAVVGYIAVQDLTKVGDIIRSRTYEAFFPLIAVAVVYFILAAILKVLIRLIARKADPRNRSAEDILKGVNVK